MELVTKSLTLTSRKRKYVILLALCGFSTYGMYKAYNLPSVSKKRKRLAKLLGTLIVITEIISDCTDILGVVSRDLKGFLESDQDQIPNSMKQLSKIAVSDEFLNSLARVFEAATLGAIQGYDVGEIEIVENSSFKDHVIDKLMSNAGTGFVSVVVGSFVRNLVLGLYSNRNCYSGSKIAMDLDRFVGALSSKKSKLVMGDLIKTFVSTVVAVYLDRAKSMNLYDGMFSGLTDFKYQKHFEDIVVYVFSGAVETFVKTSHQVLTS